MSVLYEAFSFSTSLTFGDTMSDQKNKFEYMGFFPYEILYKSSGATKIARELYLHYVRYCGGSEDGRCWASLDLLSLEVGTKRTSVIEARNLLEKLGYIAVEKLGEHKNAKTVVRIVHFWNTKEGRKEWLQEEQKKLTEAAKKSREKRPRDTKSNAQTGTTRSAQTGTTDESVVHKRAPLVVHERAPLVVHERAPRGAQTGTTVVHKRVPEEEPYKKNQKEEQPKEEQPLSPASVDRSATEEASPSAQPLTASDGVFFPNGKFKIEEKNKQPQVSLGVQNKVTENPKHKEEKKDNKQEPNTQVSLAQQNGYHENPKNKEEDKDTDTQQPSTHKLLALPNGVHTRPENSKKKEEEEMNPPAPLRGGKYENLENKTFKELNENRIAKAEVRELCVAASEKLVKALRSAGEEFLNTKISNWHNEFAQELRKTEITVGIFHETLDWYCLNCGKKFIPRVGSARTFVERFDAIRRSKRQTEEGSPVLSDPGASDALSEQMKRIREMRELKKKGNA